MSILKKICLWLCLIQINSLVSACPSSINTEDLLKGFNANFREIYALQKSKALEKLPVIIIAKGDTLVLYEKQKRTEVKYLPPLYHQYKEVSHIALLLYLLLKNEELLGEATLAKLTEVKNKMTHVLAAFQMHEHEEAQVSFCSKILKDCLTFIEFIIREKKCEDDRKTCFFRELGPLLLRNAAEASFLQLDSLHTQIQAWKKMFSSEAWNHISIVVMGPQMPRVGEVTMQYFARLTGKPLEILLTASDGLDHSSVKNSDLKKAKRRLVYAEGLPTEEEALNLLATHLIDEEIGSVFFEDKMRMHCDLLSEGASRRLKEKCDSTKCDSTIR